MAGTGIDGKDDPEGRMLVTRLEGIDLVNIDLPAGAASPEARERKDAWITRFEPWAETRERKCVEPAAGCRARVDSRRHSWFIFESPTRRCS